MPTGTNYGSYHICRRKRNHFQLQWVDSCKCSYDIELHDVEHISNSSVNLIFLSHFLKAGVKVTSEQDIITITYGNGDVHTCAIYYWSNRPEYVHLESHSHS